MGKWKTIYTVLEKVHKRDDHGILLTVGRILGESRLYYLLLFCASASIQLNKEWFSSGASLSWRWYVLLRKSKEEF
ncbi:hypothetical protein [Dubosiella newyorkensis]|uniref:hypothetical protein n=1 Tax=Dubosiella newyorkensis TaxID=1862672 RepID=UPI003F670562